MLSSEATYAKEVINSKKDSDQEDIKHNLEKQQSLMKEFNTSNNLFQSVKKKIVNDKNRCQEKIEIIDPLKFGPQHGYDSGRSSNLK